MTNVLLVGLRASSVDFTKWPDLSPERLEAAFRAVDRALRDAGFAARWCLTDDGPTAEATLRDALADFQPDVIMIGAGIRVDPEHLLLFERILNVAHELAPTARFAFNNEPLDTIAAVRRWG